MVAIELSLPLFTSYSNQSTKASNTPFHFSGPRNEGFDRCTKPEPIWKEEIVRIFSAPKVALSAYGGRLDILGPNGLELLQSDPIVEGVVLIQKGDPNDLLLGTDFQSRLGFRLVIDTPDKVVEKNGVKDLYQ